MLAKRIYKIQKELESKRREEPRRSGRFRQKARQLNNDESSIIEERITRLKHSAQCRDDDCEKVSCSR